MKRKVRLFLLLLCVFIMAWGMTANAEDFSISQKTAAMNIGDLLELRVSDTDKKPVWISYNENIVKVDQNGTVTALRAGKTTIKVRSGFQTKTCTVKVVNSSIKLNKTTATIYHGGTSVNTLQLKATVKGATKDVVWESSDTNVATVDAKGKVTSVSAGTTTITATANGKSASCTITVKESSIALNMDTMQLSNKGTGSSMKLTPAIIGSKKTVKWVSSDKTIATVSNGKITGKKSGTATITATANGISDTCVVTVTDGLVSINEEKVLLYVGGTKTETKQLKTNAKKQDVLAWSSSNDSIATVENGLVTAKGEGTAIIKVECNGKIDSCEVTVKNTVTEIGEDTVFLRTKGSDKTYQLNSSVTGRSSSVKWISSDNKVASVNKGKVTAKKVGTATITATANGVSDSVTVTVEDFLPTIKLNQSNYVLYTNKGNTLNLKATVDGKNKTVSWSSSNDAVATVNKGKVTAVSEGEAIISATANDVTAECLITVRQSKVILENENLHLNKGEKGNIPVDVIGTSQTIKWSSTNSKVATVKNGVVTAKNYGEADIKVTANGITAICHVDVSECQHKFDAGKVTKEPSCTEEGTCLYTCTICGYSYTESIPTVEHKWGAWKTVKESTETEMGMQIRTCTVCGMEENSFLPVLEHTHKYEVVVTEPTCTEDGYTTYKCSCGDIYTGDVIPALGHKWGEWQVIKEPTEKETGERLHVCSTCKAEETEEIPNLSHIHDYKAVVTAPTCTEDGYTTYECSCGDSYTGDIVPALGHKWGEWQVIKEATESETGEKKHICNVCGAEETENIPVLEHVHKYSATVTEPTCTEQGYTTYTCQCGDYYRDDFVDTVAHVPSEWVITREPTCGVEGVKETHCINCNCTMEIEMIDKLQEHDYKVKSVKEPTNCGYGYTIYECSVCGATKQDDYIPYTGGGVHKWDFDNKTLFGNWDGTDRYQVFCKVCASSHIFTMDEILREQEVDSKVKEVISEIITDDMIDVEKIFAVNKWICLNCYYDYDTYNNTENRDDDSNYAYGMLFKGKAVCGGYAEAFQEFMHELGIECRAVVGWIHEWNQVKLDDGWYWIDCTWNDPKRPGMFTCNYFLRTGQRVEDEERNEDDGVFCDGTKWETDWLLLFDKYKASNDNELNSIYELQKENDIVYFRFNSESDYEIFMDVNGEYFEKYREYIDYEITVKDTSDTKMYLMFMKNTDNLRAFFSERTLTITDEPESVESSKSVGSNEIAEDSEAVKDDEVIEDESSEDNEIVENGGSSEEIDPSEDSESIVSDEFAETDESMEENELTEENESSEVNKTIENSGVTEEDKIVEENESTATSMLLVS